MFDTFTMWILGRLCKEVHSFSRNRTSPTITISRSSVLFKLLARSGSTKLARPMICELAWDNTQTTMWPLNAAAVACNRSCVQSGHNYHGYTWSWAEKVCRAGHFAGGVCVWCVKIMWPNPLAVEDVKCAKRYGEMSRVLAVVVRPLSIDWPEKKCEKKYFHTPKGKRRLKNYRPSQPSRPTIKCIRGALETQTWSKKHNHIMM